MSQVVNDSWWRIAARSLSVLGALGMSATAWPQSLPPAVQQQLPKDREVLTWASGDFNHDGLPDYVVVLRSANEAAPAPTRPLLAFLGQRAGAPRLIARNDAVVMRADEGGQCDPFDPDEQGLAVKEAYFTVQNGVACGSHWTDYLTFRFDAVSGQFVFHSRITETYEFDPNPNATEALKRSSRTVRKEDPRHPVSLADYRDTESGRKAR